MRERRLHDWEQIDSGTAYCIHCPATLGEFNDLSGDPYPALAESHRRQAAEQAAAPQPKTVENVKVELQKVRRELLTLANRVEKIVKGQEQA
jgi:hypothetical protein